MRLTAVHLLQSNYPWSRKYYGYIHSIQYLIDHSKSLHLFIDKSEIPKSVLLGKMGNEILPHLTNVSIRYKTRTHETANIPFFLTRSNMYPDPGLGFSKSRRLDVTSWAILWPTSKALLMVERITPTGPVANHPAV